MLHPRVLFVSNAPNPKFNRHLLVPLIGSTAYKIFLYWIYRMDLDIRLVEILDAYDVNGNLKEVELRDKLSQFEKVVSLGPEAKEAIKTVDETKKFFTLPYPSPEVREDVGAAELATGISRCKRYIYKRQ